MKHLGFPEANRDSVLLLKDPANGQRRVVSQLAEPTNLGKPSESDGIEGYWIRNSHHGPFQISFIKKASLGGGLADAKGINDELVLCAKDIGYGAKGGFLK